jgi:quercetin dioxygenase-like cupin family protein
MSDRNHTHVTHHRLADMPAETMKGTIQRRLVTGERVMLAEVTLKTGDEVPQHHHEHEQISYVMEGRLRFFLGAEGERVVEVASGEVLVIPSNVPHRVLALADTYDIDLFNPPRQDWLDGTDAYLRR